MPFGTLAELSFYNPSPFTNRKYLKEPQSRGVFSSHSYVAVHVNVRRNSDHMTTCDDRLLLAYTTKTESDLWRR
jgi:hypothetical protein